METLFSDRAIVGDYMETLFSDRAIVSDYMETLFSDRAIVGDREAILRFSDYSDRERSYGVIEYGVQVSL